MKLIQTLLAIFRGDLEPGTIVSSDGITIRILSKTKFALELTGEMKTECDFSDFQLSQSQDRAVD